LENLDIEKHAQGLISGDQSYLLIWSGAFLAFGIWLIAAAIFGQFIGKRLPSIDKTWAKVVLFIFGIIFALPGGFFTYKILVPPTLIVLTGLSEDEYNVFEELIDDFEREFRVYVNIKNVHWKDALKRLETGEDIDLITFDINGWRSRLVEENLIEDLSKVKGLIPDSVHPALIQNNDFGGKRFFIPFRPNVRLIFWNKEKYRKSENPTNPKWKNGCEPFQEDFEISNGPPSSWAQVLNIAARVDNPEVRVVVNASSSDAPLLLLELIRSAGGDPLNLLDTKSKKAIKFLRCLWPSVSPKSSYVDWRTATGFLLSGSVYFARNWTFALTRIHKGQDLSENETDKAVTNPFPSLGNFQVSSGLRWKDDKKTASPKNLLGGEYLALPKTTEYKDLAKELIRFLVREDVQKRIVEKQSWPAMRLDVFPGSGNPQEEVVPITVKGGTPPKEQISKVGSAYKWQRHFREVINEALLGAKPVPNYWWPDMPDIYGRLFSRLVKLDPRDDDLSFLTNFQNELDRLNLKESKE